MEKTEIPFLTRPIAITDCEMTGLDISRHELIELGLVLVQPDDFEIIDTLNLKIKPEHPENADPKALEINGYDEELWRDAITLKEAMELYAEKTAGAVFSSYNVAFDWIFLDDSFRKTGIKHSMDYHMIDVPSVIWAKLKDRGLTEIRLKKVCEYLGIEPEPKIHRAVNGAMSAWQVLKKLAEMR